MAKDPDATGDAFRHYPSTDPNAPPASEDEYARLAAWEDALYDTKVYRALLVERGLHIPNVPPAPLVDNTGSSGVPAVPQAPVRHP